MPVRAQRLTWRDLPYGEFDLPRKTLRLTLGLGSGLTRRAGDGALFAVTDRGPNMFASTAVDDYGLTAVEHLRATDAKIMPAPERGPEIVELAIDANTVRAIRSIPLTTRTGARVSGLPMPAADQQDVENIFGIDGNPILSKDLGADAEAIAAMPDGGFFVAEEYGPSLLKVGPDGVVAERWVPAGAEALQWHADLPARGILPSSLASRRSNRGLEACARLLMERGFIPACRAPWAARTHALLRSGSSMRKPPHSPRNGDTPSTRPPPSGATPHAAR